MLLIRSEQMRVFENARMQAWLARDMRERYPQATASLTESALLAFTRAAADQAAGSGLREPRDIRAFVHVVWMLGTNFQKTAPAWARRIISDHSFRDPGARLRVLEQAAEKKLGGNHATAAFA